MSRPIDADALKRRCRQLIQDPWNHSAAPTSWADAYRAFIDEIDSAPTIDAVPVVRCRECIHWVGDFPGATEYVKRCEWAGYMVGENGYCVYGEREEYNHE